MAEQDTPHDKTTDGIERIVEENSPQEPTPDWMENSIGTKLMSIPAGDFQLGSTEFTHSRRTLLVRISRPFYLAAYPVTQREYTRVIERNPSFFSNHDVLPVECVSWFDAVTFCNALSSKEGLHPFFKIDGELIDVPDWSGPGYRLPTEAEWEYACRAGSTTRYYFGDDEKLLHQYAWYAHNSNHRTHPVGEKKPNRFGLYDMNGNVSEWCWDWFESGYYSVEETHCGARDTQQGDERILRGGSFVGDSARSICSALRLRKPPSTKDTNIGFRLARNL